MAASRMFLILLSIALLSLTSAQRDNADDDNTQQEESLGVQDLIPQQKDDIKNHIQEELSQNGNMPMMSRKEKSGQSGKRGPGGEILRGQGRQNGNQQASRGQGKGGQGKGGQGSRGQGKGGQGGRGQGKGGQGGRGQGKGGQGGRGKRKGGQGGQRENEQRFSEE